MTDEALFFERSRVLTDEVPERDVVSPSPLMYYTYLLYSPRFQKTYVGQTDNVHSRLKTHNFGKVRSTKGYRPWGLIYYEEYGTRGEAVEREKWFKSKSGRKQIARLLAEKNAEAQVCPIPTDEVLSFDRSRSLFALH